MKLNPYQSPLPDVRHDDDPNDYLGHGEGSKSDAATRWTLRALRLIRLGDAFQLVCVSALGLQLLVMSPSAKTPSTLPSLVALVAIGTGVALSFFGLVLLTSQAYRRHSTSLLAVALQVIGAEAVTSFVISMIRAHFLGGFMPLFGAAAFSLLLTSKALVALIIQARTAHMSSRNSVRWGYLAVICYAFCAALTSALSLKAMPTGISTSFTLALIFVFGLAATAFRLNALRQAILSLTPQRTHTHLDNTAGFT